MVSTTVVKCSNEAARPYGLLNCLDFRNWCPPQNYSFLNLEKLKTTGLPEYTSLKGFKTTGLEVTEHKFVNEDRLKLFRLGRLGASIGAVVLNALAALGLFYSGTKLFFNSIRGSDVEDSYKSLGKAYSASAIAGALTGAAHESSEWSIGNVGMGIFSRYLENIWGLAGFSISEGLASIGMGKVRYRDKRNVYSVKNSLFNIPQLSALRFLMPVEQSVINFFKRLISPRDWKRFAEEEPYSLFQTAGGGLITGGGILAVASLFKNKMSEKLQSFFYLPYSFFSLANLVAFFRDGDVQITRSKDFGSRKKGETFSMRGEGNCKKIATPFLALNNLLLGLKGLGIDTHGGIMYNLAMAARSWGAGIAFLAFKAQSLLKFFKPDLFGPRLKEVVKINLYPNKESEEVFAFNDELEKNRPKPRYETKFDTIIYSGDNREREIIDLLLNTPTLDRLKSETQIGLPTPNNPPLNDRPYLQRFTHSKRVCAIAILIYNALLKNTTDKELKQTLLESREAFILSGLLHDIGHIARSHLAELAVKGHNNDEYTIEILKDPNSDICRTITTYYGQERGEKILKQVRDIIGRWSPLYKSFKIADYVEYLRCGDFSCVDGFPKWTPDEVKEYVEKVRLYKDKSGSTKVAFTEKGAIETFIMLFDRKVFNDSYNHNPICASEQLPYLLGLDAADVSSKEIKEMREKEVDKAVKRGLELVKGSNFQVRLRQITGGEDAYCGYSKFDPEKKIMVYVGDKTEPVEFLDYLERVIRSRDPDLYDELRPRVHGLVTPRELDLTINVVG